MGLFKKKAITYEFKERKTSESAANDTTITIADIENAVRNSANTPDEAFGLEIAGMAYLNGDYGAQENIDKALFYFGKLEEIGVLKGKYLVGKCYVIKGLKTGEKALFISGVIQIYSAYKLGYTEAEKDLRISYESGFFENIHSFEEFLAFLEYHTAVK